MAGSTSPPLTARMARSCGEPPVRQEIAAQLVADINGGKLRIVQPQQPRGNERLCLFHRHHFSKRARSQRTDGTTTQIVKDIFPGATGQASISNLTAINGMLYFAAESDTNSGIQPWESDGTATGMIKLHQHDLLAQLIAGLIYSL